MANDDWIGRILEDRAAAEERAAAAAGRRRNYEAKAEGFWSRIVAEIERAVAVYNASDQGEKVRVGKAGHQVSVSSAGRRALVDISINNQAEELRVVGPVIRPDGTRSDQSERACAIASTGAGDLTLRDSQTVEDYVRDALEPFLRHVNDLI